ncbi:MAG: hypothetical protein QXT53_04515 [Ignisphaera sp.]
MSGTSCRKTLHPIQAISVAVAIAIAVSMLSNTQLLLAILVAVIVSSIFINLGALASVAKVVTPLATIYTLLASIIQFIVIGFVDVSIILINILRIAAVATVSISLISCVNIPKLLEFSYRLSPTLGISLALSVKMLKSLPMQWTFIYRLYRNNLPCNSYLDRIETFVLSVKAFLFLALYSSIQSVEAILTRSKILRLDRQR